jgi:tRNA modification GTPase
MSEATIYALATGVGRAAIGVFRLSGSKVPDVVKAFAGNLPEPRRARLVSFRDPHSGAVLDRGLVLFFPAPASFTGEDAAEFHIHGGHAVAAAFVRAFETLPDLRAAEPGEFTRRAFLNGKLDLSAVEGIADLIEAETELQRRQALQHMSGALRDRALLWRSILLEASARLEGSIDFADEADVSGEFSEALRQLLDPLVEELERDLSGRAGERIRDGLTIMLAGPPNAGKSTLLNALARRDVAIVSPYPGTTRDLLEVRLDIEGVAVILLDTAGLRESIDPVEAIGIERAKQKSQSADLVLWLCEAGSPQVPDIALESHLEVWPITTKADLELGGQTKGSLSVSAQTGFNLDLLWTRLAAFTREKSGGGEPRLITRQRHREAFQRAAESLRRMLSDVERPVEFLAEDLRVAIRALESLVGGVDADDVLGEIFSRFCIGK